MELSYKPFAEIDFDSSFFQSLKDDYHEIGDWFVRKSQEGSSAYVFSRENGDIDGFLYLKIEEGIVSDVEPPLPEGRHLKIGTLKINAHGTKLGERFIKKIVDHIILHDLNDAYVTVFEKHTGLISLLKKHGFDHHGTKTTRNGIEQVLIKRLSAEKGSPSQNFPCVRVQGVRKWLLAIWPEYHSLMFPDSILRNEDPRLIVRDVSHTNSIHKVYLCNMADTARMETGDVVVMYRTSDQPGRAWFRAVATSICVVEEVAHMDQFGSLEDFLSYCRPHSVFPEHELVDFYKSRKNQFIIKVTYNIALNKRPNRGKLINEAKINEALRWSCIQLNDSQFDSIVKMGEINERLIVN